MKFNTAGSQPLYCNFCGKSQYHVKRLIASPEVQGWIFCICDECTLMAYELVQIKDTTAEEQHGRALELFQGNNKENNNNVHQPKDCY